MMDKRTRDVIATAAARRLQDAGVAPREREALAEAYAAGDFELMMFASPRVAAAGISHGVLLACEQMPDVLREIARHAAAGDDTTIHVGP
jgi:hypothetical protein